VYKIETKPYGYKLTFAGHIDVQEMTKWAEESKRVLSKKVGKFGVLIDMTTLSPISSERQEVLVSGQQLYKQKGMERSAVALNSLVVTLQFKRLARESGIYAWERYIDAGKLTNWERVAEDWIAKGTDPDKKAG